MTDCRRRRHPPRSLEFQNRHHLAEERRGMFGPVIAQHSVTNRRGPLRRDTIWFVLAILGSFLCWHGQCWYSPTTLPVRTSSSSSPSSRPTRTSSMIWQSKPDISLEMRNKKIIWNRLVKTFQGDFDNYHQVVDDRRKGLHPREGGGHENFHFTLIPVSDRGRLAAFYFDGNPERIFRFRYYELFSTNDDDEGSHHDDDNDDDDDDDDKVVGVGMRLYTLNADLERLLRQHSEVPSEWPKLFSSYDDGGDGSSSSMSRKMDYLPNCEIVWSLEKDPVQHSYIDEMEDDDDDDDDSKDKEGLHAVMVHGEAIVDSTLLPGIKIRILDQLSLYEDIFYINDRGLDPETGAFIYGNQRGIPYRLERVTRLVDGQREVVNADLQWTLGPSWRTQEEYVAKIDAVGGPSIQMKAPIPPPQPNPVPTVTNESP